MKGKPGSYKMRKLGSDSNRFLNAVTLIVQWQNYYENLNAYQNATLLFDMRRRSIIQVTATSICPFL